MYLTTALGSTLDLRSSESSSVEDLEPSSDSETRFLRSLRDLRCFDSLFLLERSFRSFLRRRRLWEVDGDSEEEEELAVSSPSSSSDDECLCFLVLLLRPIDVEFRVWGSLLLTKVTTQIFQNGLYWVLFLKRPDPGQGLCRVKMPDWTTLLGARLGPAHLFSLHVTHWGSDPNPIYPKMKIFIFEVLKKLKTLLKITTKHTLRRVWFLRITRLITRIKHMKCYLIAYFFNI